MDEDWWVLRSLLPSGWRELGRVSGALKGLRTAKSAEVSLRVLLLHLGCGHSLRETSVRARESGLARLSDVAVLKRLRKSSGWLRGLCAALLRERGATACGGFEVRTFDATTVREPGRTGSLWRVHYSLRLPSLRCDFFEVTPARGSGNGERFTRFPVGAGDHILADRGYATAAGLRHVSAAGGWVTVRVNTVALPLQAPDGTPFDLLAAVSGLTSAGAVGAWPVSVGVSVGGPPAVPGRVCAVRKSVEAARRARKKARREARRQGSKVKPETLVYADYVIVFTTFPEDRFGAREVLECYRLRWQVELVFKRLKSLARLGHLPKRDPESARAWLYGKLLLALLADKAIRHARAVSPWGYDLAPPPNP